MLEYLRIQNLALIEDMSLDFSTGINVLTGETGAGKSFILKALNFLTGERLNSDLVRPGKEKAVVEALFSMPDGDLILHREFTADNSRSKLFINDRLSSQETVRELKPSLILHTSQHGQQKLLQSNFQAQILDDFFNRPDLLQKRDGLIKQLTELADKSRNLHEKANELSEKRDLLEYQRQEIDQVSPEEGEEEELELKRQELRNHEVATHGVEIALALLHGENGSPGIMEEITLLEKTLHKLSALDASLEEDLHVLQELAPTLHDLSPRLRKLGKKPARGSDVEDIEHRLFALAQLKRKLHRSMPEILSLRNEIEANLSFLDSCQLDLKQLERQEYALCEELAELMQELNPARKEAAVKFSASLEEELKELGFSEHVSVEFVFTPRQIYHSPSKPEGDHPSKDCLEEKPQLYWKPNPGQTAQPLEKIASGGELSRFLLAVVSLMSSRTDETPVLIFDEVDAGVGGLTLNKVSEKLLNLGKKRQMILITHWPKLATTAQRHFFVNKEVSNNETFTRCVQLEGADITKELSRMAGESA